MNTSPETLSGELSSCGAQEDVADDAQYPGLNACEKEERVWRPPGCGGASPITKGFIYQITRNSCRRLGLGLVWGTFVMVPNDLRTTAR